MLTIPRSRTFIGDVVQIISAVVTPAIAAPGTLRTITVVATASAPHQVLSAVAASLPPGTVFTPVPGQPTNTFAWTFTY